MDWNERDCCAVSAPRPPVDFSTNRPEIEPPIRPVSGHARMMSCLECDLPELQEETRPPDPEFVDLIDQAFLEGQIESQRADLAYLCLLRVLRTKAGTFAGTKGN